MWQITIYWFLKPTEERTKRGHDTYLSQKPELPSEIDFALDQMMNSEYEPRKNDFKNFYQATIAPRAIENWGVDRVITKKISVVPKPTEAGQ